MLQPGIPHLKRNLRKLKPTTKIGQALSTQDIGLHVWVDTGWKTPPILAKTRSFLLLNMYPFFSRLQKVDIGMRI